jgi:hypothetical protein
LNLFIAGQRAEVFDAACSRKAKKSGVTEKKVKQKIGPIDESIV